MGKDKSAEVKELLKNKTLPEIYAANWGLRLLITQVPRLGGAVDLLLAGAGAKIRERRIREFLEDLTGKLQKIEKEKAIAPSEGLWDLVVEVLESVARARTAEKRRRFAAIIANQVRNDEPYEDAINAAHLLADLEDIHIAVMRAALNAPTVWTSAMGKPAVILYESEETKYGADNQPIPPRLSDLLPKASFSSLLIACSQLVSKGLLHDDSIGRAASRPMEIVAATDAAEWLVVVSKDVVHSLPVLRLAVGS